MARFCGVEMKEYVPKGWDSVEIKVKCGNTSPSGEPWEWRKLKRKKK